MRQASNAVGSGAPDRPRLLAAGAADGGKVHDHVVRTIAASVLGGRFPPGSTLPREEELAEIHGVSRTSIREAVKVLSAKGLIEAKPRIGVRVRPRADWRLLDPAVLAWHPNIRTDEELMTGLLEARRIIEPAAAELAAQRANGSDLAAIEEAFLRMEASMPADIAACCDADVAFHRALVAASHNIVLRNLLGTIEAALRATFEVTNELMAAQKETLAVHGAVLEHVRLRDPAAARAAMNSLLDRAASDLLSETLRPLSRGSGGDRRP
jgi:GntR family transcriptional regulator, galactonate operon transcriptional repressor